MNLRLISKPRAALTGVAAGLSLTLAGAAIGQTPAVVAPAAAEFRSALESYRPYTEEKTASWKEANDTVGRIGGWRAYAKEAQQTQLPSPPSAASKSDPQAGHAKPPQVKP
ncbi:MAG: hypothetical protein Q8O29_11650 [Polaromonas sp.]|uniref:hypothetical protein n=1 Tax=Polaromonas sp. TaxID=1869339 RepID=UPI0027361518|nr:hypothetical protein [Polaromonas sp.]MDP2818903.1 hypothetical protein [Polaromonas sp.]